VIDHSLARRSKVKKLRRLSRPTMRLCTFSLASEEAGDGRLGLVEGMRVFEVEGRKSMLEHLASGDRKVLRVGEGHELAELRIYAPVPRPGKIVAAIVNTKGMLGGDDVRLDRPRLDMKAPSTVVGTGVTIRAPASGIRPEVELAAVVGRRLSKASPIEARKGIAGYTVLNDVTAPRDSKDDAYEAYRRDPKTGEIRKATMRGPLFRSKNHDGFCPMGPYLVTPDELEISDGLRMTTKFEGRLVQDGSTNEYIFRPEELASYVSGFLTLEPGDVVSCGSVGWTRKAIGSNDPTEFVLQGQKGKLEVEIERLGVLVNTLVPE
jgi:2-keto-4-pentenoate hydratase/2-oxohepta-3-ene-1,7-dioic acid hydratase in catechol pathway